MKKGGIVTRTNLEGVPRWADSSQTQDGVQPSQSVFEGAAAAASAGHVLVAQTPYTAPDEILSLLENSGTYRPPVGLVQRWLEAGAESDDNQHKLVEELTREIARLDDGLPSLVPVGSTLSESLLGEWVAQYHDVQVMLFYTRPEKAMAAVMEEGVEPTAALEQWQAAATHLLRLHRRNRVRSRVIDVDRALSAPVEFLSACRQQLGLGLAAPSQVVEVIAEPSRRDPVYELIAAQLVSQSEEALSLARELDASALPMGERSQPGHVDCLRVYQAVASVRQELTAECAARERAENSVQRIEKELTEERNGRESEHQARQEAERHLAKFREEAERRDKELKQENEEMLAQLHQVQEELEAYFIRTREEEKKRKAAEKERKERNSKAKEFFKAKKTQQARAEHYRNRLAAVHSSTSWKVTVPVRVIKRLLTGRPLRSRKKPVPKIPTRNA